VHATTLTKWRRCLGPEGTRIVEAVIAQPLVREKVVDSSTPRSISWIATSIFGAVSISPVMLPSWHSWPMGSMPPHSEASLKY
jgi:hypothetical protein